MSKSGHFQFDCSFNAAECLNPCCTLRTLWHLSQSLSHRFTTGAACVCLLARVKGVIHIRFLCDVCHLMRTGFDSGLNHWLTEQDYSLGGNMWPFELNFSNLLLLYRAQLRNILASFREKHTAQVRSLHTLFISMEVELIWSLLCIYSFII